MRIRIPFKLRTRERAPKGGEEQKDVRAESYGDFGAAMGRFVGSKGYWSVEHVRAFFMAKAALSERRREQEERL